MAEKSPCPILVEKSPPPLIIVEKSPPSTPTPKAKLEDFELGYSSLGVATVASAAFATATLVPSSLQSFAGCAALALTGVFWLKETFSSETKEFSLAAKQLALSSLLLLPLGFYSFTLQRS